MNGIPLTVPLLIGAVAVGIGILGKRGEAYWIRAAAAVVVAFAMSFLGAAGGTLDDPAGDGLITRWIREATDDGAAVALWGIAMLLVGYGLIIILLVIGVRADALRKASPPRE